MRPAISFSFLPVPRKRRVFWIFKPNEVVQGEKFDIKFTFKNSSDEDFLGGTCFLTLLCPEVGLGISDDIQMIDIPSIAVGEQTTTTVNNVAPLRSGLNGIRLRSQAYRDGNGNENGEDFIYDSKGELMTGSNIAVFDVSSRDELYQKYSVLVAIGSSIVATITSIIAIVIAIIR